MMLQAVAATEDSYHGLDVVLAPVVSITMSGI